MKASPVTPAAQRQCSGDRPSTSEEGVNIPLLEESLAKTVWERMLANDDALRLADLLRAAVLKTRAKS
jgi:hypothetical protein